METVAVLFSTQISANYLGRADNQQLKLRIPTPNIRKSSSLFDGRSVVRANSPKFQSQREEEEEETRAPNEKPPFISKEDLDYVVKLGGGSVLGAIAIKYGSIILPEITRPNIVEAMIMISAPVLLAVSILIIQSK